MTTAQSLITIGIIALGTVFTRFLPFWLFPKGKPGAAHRGISGKGAALCCDGPVGGVLFEGCAAGGRALRACRS